MINENENKILYIIRGVPGSGKSTLAHSLTDNVAEADQFMYEDGEYKWSPAKLYMAHEKCYNKIVKWIEDGVSPIAVANTFVKIKDYKRYKDFAEQNGYKVIIKICDGNYNNVHNVSDETVERMRRRFQK